MKDIYDFKDIHTHRLPGNDYTIVNLNYDKEVPSIGFYSIGLHPWQTVMMNKESIEYAIHKIFQKATADNVIAIGECGIDRFRGTDLQIQKNILRKHIILSENIHKPLIIHAVRANDIILSLKKEMNPHQLWIIHGFRGKPLAAQQFIENGIAISYGEKFNRDSVVSTPVEMLFTETDESELSISEIRKKIYKYKGLYCN